MEQAIHSSPAVPQPRHGMNLRSAHIYLAWAYPLYQSDQGCISSPSTTSQLTRQIPCITDTAASDRRTASPAKHRRMPGLWRTVQQLRKGGGSVGGASSADNQIRRSSIASPENRAGTTVPSPERNGSLSLRAADCSLPGQLMDFDPLLIRLHGVACR